MQGKEGERRCARTEEGLVTRVPTLSVVGGDNTTTSNGGGSGGVGQRRVGRFTSKVGRVAFRHNFFKRDSNK